MKKSLLLAALLFCCGSILAQNVQLHYDLGKQLYDDLSERPELTSTVEMFRPDGFGSTFFFIDMDYSPRVTSAYWEIARELNFWQDSKWSWLSVHVEYNGGGNTTVGGYNNSWLGGLTYSGHSQDFSKTWSLSAMYKCIPGTKDAANKRDIHNFQITGVWGIQFANGWCSHSGFVDFWREQRPWQGTSHILLAETRLWVNLNKIPALKQFNLSIGTELELSNNFVGKGFYAIPTLAAKWEF
ncbi:MAG: DUF5020 family protein [Alistipes sp.]|nr:DUF5020 family protein [Alistipes sp.]MBR5849854.1 DUF5020 family protein [Alistipes sp.]